MQALLLACPPRKAPHGSHVSYKGTSPTPFISDWWNDVIEGKTKHEKQNISIHPSFGMPGKSAEPPNLYSARLTYVEVSDIAREDILQRETSF
jgi:hypothetical protein